MAPRSLPTVDVDVDVDRISPMSTIEPATGTKRSRRRELLIGDLLDRSTELFATQGYEATSLQDIADAVGISRPALYHYLRSKEDLLAMLVEQMSRSLAKVLEQLRERPDLSPLEKIADLTALLVRERARHPGRFRILDRTENILPEPAGSEHIEAKRQIVRELISIIEDGIAIGQIRPIEPRTAAFSLLGMCNWTAWWINPSDAENIDAIASTMVDCAEAMFAAPTTPGDAFATPQTLLSEIRDRVDRISAQL